MRLAIPGLLLALVACATPTGAPPGAGLFRVEPRPGVTLPLAQGETRLVVRAVPAGAPGQELSGVPCQAESTFFTADFTAPAALLLPDYGSASPLVTVTCRNGAAKGSAVAKPQPAWSGGLGGWPAVGISVGTGGYSGVGVGMGWSGGGVGTQTPVTRYPELRIPLA